MFHYSIDGINNTYYNQLINHVSEQNTMATSRRTVKPKVWTVYECRGTGCNQVMIGWDGKIIDREEMIFSNNPDITSKSSRKHCFTCNRYSAIWFIGRYHCCKNPACLKVIIPFDKNGDLIYNLLKAIADWYYNFVKPKNERMKATRIKKMEIKKKRYQKQNKQIDD